MSSEQLLAAIDKSLELQYETLGKAKKRLAMTDEIFAKIAIEQRIREELLPQICKDQSEYWKLLSQCANSYPVQESDAEYAIHQVIRDVELVKSDDYADKLMRLLQEIKDKLNQPGTSAAAKAKLALPLIPGILSYEIELDTENSLRQIFQPLKQLFRGEAEKK
ncbi:MULTISPECIES: hypothetical protein [unclassified Microcoleus]|uniref:hypothetical protein n=1 Tax=unclassified Microcoleus TaxID=2642155 RepID=UPI0025EE85BE|nr:MULTISPECIES: hypothetical protein [unclassified Microcoleus]